MAPVRRGDGKAAVPESERAQFANARRADVARIAAELRELKAAKAGKEAVRAKAWELLEQKYLLCLHSPEPVTAPELVVATSPTHVMKVRWGIRVAARGRENSVRASGGAAYSSNVVKLQHKFYNRVRLEGHEVIEAISSHTARRFPDLAPSLCKLEVVERHEADGGDGAAPTVRKVYSQLQPNTVLRMPLTNPGPVLSFTTVIEIRATFQTAPPAVPSDLPPLVDLGVNLSNERFEKSLGKVIDRAVQAGVTQQVSLATELWDSTFGVALSKSRPGTLFTTVGVHPTRACDALKAMSVDATRNALAALVKASRVRALYEGEPSSLHQTVVAIGECGLCFTDGTTEEDKKVQLAVLEMQLKLAGELQLPVIMQERGAFSDILPLVEKYASTVPNLIVSCFNGPKKHLQAYVDNGLFIGVTGLLCNDARNTELVTALSSVVGIRDRLMVSSDAPFLTPFNMPKPFPKDNEPFTLPYVVQKLAIELEADVHALAQELAARSRTVLSLNDQSFSEPAQGGERHKAVPADNPNCDYAFYGPSAQSFAPSKPQ